MIDEQGRPEPPIDADEAATLLGFLDFQRATLRWKCDGVDESGMRATTAATRMTLGGLLKHLAFVEDYWFSVRLHGHEPSAPWLTADWEADHDWDWTSASADSPASLFDLWNAAVERSRDLVSLALTRGDLGQLAARPWPSGESPSLRWILVHMIEEYARHNGHADLLREAVDGGAIGE